MTQDKAHKLSIEILDFLAKHGKRSAQEPEEWNGPDPCTLESVAKWLLVQPPNIPKPRIFSEWGSGCYQPYSDKKAKNWHDDLIRRIEKL